ncbi:DUF4139 domain-containing protein [Ideonella sp.]|uniref:DUF4139 domain-containing protein n=1 Tax=Ideonella sp. TaxID=1929293 RepID=UPI003BB7D152
MIMSRPPSFPRAARWSLCALPAALAAASLSVQAQAPATQSSVAPISQVQVFPGGATVERAARVAAGARELALSCLPARFDAESLQVQASAGVRLGEISIETLPRVQLPECADSPLDLQIRALEDQKSVLAAETGALDLVLGYLKGFGPAEGKAGNNAAAAPQINATADGLRRSGQDTLLRQQQLARKLEALDQQLAPLLAEREQVLAQNPTLRRVRVKLATAADGEVRLSYRVPQAGWTPVYRAYLDTERGQLRLERHAQVAQNSGEDWRGVSLKLSTTQPRQASGLPSPSPWTLNLQTTETLTETASFSRQRTFAAAAPMAAPAPPPSGAMADDLPSFDVSALQGEFAAEFSVPGKVQVASNGQRVSLLLGQTPLEAKLHARVQPQQSTQAYLVAEAARPAGSWPRGTVQLFRDNTTVGQGSLDLAGDEGLTLFFGPDEQLRVKLLPEQRGGGETGLIASRKELRLTRRYELENRHARPVTVQVLEASPSPQHDDIRVQARYSPEPSLTSWKKLPGVVAWVLPLAAGQSQTLSADYTVSVPKDARLEGWR